MESGNSGSFQSSTGDEEFDSLGDGISALNNLVPTSFANQQVQPPPPPPQRPLQRDSISSYMYDHHHPPPQPPPPPLLHQEQLENYQSSFLNSYVLDWSNNNTQRSDTNSTDFNPMLASILASSSSHHHGSTPPPQPSLHQHHPPPSAAVENSRVSLLEPPPPKKPRKRSRASRGAATTVLTTDTTNFRAMVQEFTGIPDPPFTPTSHFQRTRLENIFGTAISGSSGITTTTPYLRRPFPQKLNLPFSSFLGSSSSSSNYQFTPQSQSSSLFNLQTQVHPPSSSLQKSHHQELSSNGDFNRNDQINTNMLTGPATGFLDLISSTDHRQGTTSTINNNNQGASLRWGNNNNNNGTVGSNQQDGDQNLVIETTTTNSNFSFSSS